MTGNDLGLVELSEDCLGQNLAEFHTHLVWSTVSDWCVLRDHGSLTKGVDSPNNTLDEDFVLIKGDQCACHNADQHWSGRKTKANGKHTESSGRHQWEDDAVAWPVTLEDLTLDQRLAGVCPQLLPNLFLGLSEGQSLGLSEEVGEEDTVVERVTDRVKRGGGGDEICGDQLGSLVNKLVERVLAIRSSSTPDDGLKHHNNQQSPKIFLGTETYTGLIVHTLTALGNKLSV